jgi:hypothetical protein
MTYAPDGTTEYTVIIIKLEMIGESGCGVF